MFTLLTHRAHAPLLFKSSAAKRHFSVKLNSKLNSLELVNLLFFIFKHLDPSFRHTNNNQEHISFLHEQAKNIFNNAEKLHSNTERKVIAIARESICKNMHTIIKRQPDSKMGVMYEKNYFSEILAEKNSYAEHELELQSKPKREYPYFKTGQSICHFIAKTNMPASEALNSFFGGPTAADCGSTVEAVYLKAVLDVLGADKFNKLFSTRKQKLQIKPCASVIPSSPSSITNFMEFINPKIFQKVDEEQLQVRDHIFISGTPWYHLKHPRGVMGGMHGIVIDRDEQKKPLITGLEFDAHHSIEQVQQALVNCSNAPQTENDTALCQAYYGSRHLSAKQIATFFEDKPKLQQLTYEDILNLYSLEEVKFLGGCKLENINASRLSSYVLAVLQQAPLESDLQHTLHIAKAVTLARRIFE